MISFFATLFNYLLRRETQYTNLQMTKKVWTPENILNLKTQESSENFAIIVLNRPINIDPIFTANLWNKASIRTLVDGGANHWLQFIESCSIQLKNPDLLTGDFDSITPATIQCIRSMGAKILCTPNQDETDFTKSLMELNENFIHNYNIGYVVVLLDTSGRIDHLLSHINTLFKAQKFLSQNVNVFILAKESISWLLTAGNHTFHIPKHLVEKEIWCSYVPIGSSCSVTTTGFKWNLENKIVKFGGMVSTSNTYQSDLLTIETNGYLYWSMGFDTNDD